LETLSINSIIKDSPAAVALLDVDLCFIGHSDVWLETFVANKGQVIGKSYYDVVPNVPELFKKIHQDCLKGESNQNKGKKFVHSNGAVQWLKWKINPWKAENGDIGGLIIVQEEITETRRREELLLKAEQVARIGGWEVDMITNAVYWTEVTREIHEVPEDYIPNLEEGINFYQEGLHREKITELVTESMTTGASWDTELIIVTAKGNELWVRSKGEAEIIKGKCVRIYGTFQDINDKKKTELSFLEATKRLEIATKGAKVGIWDFDIVNNKLVWDDSMYQLYGIRKEDFIGEYEAWQAGLHPEDKKKGDEEIAMAISGEKEFDTEFRVIWPNGEIRYIRAIAVTQRDANGKALNMTGTNWDITELKTTKMMLQKSEESLQGAFENSNIGMALVGLDGRWTKVNESLCQSLGYSEEDLMKMTFQDITHPDDLDKDLSLLKTVIKGERESYQIEKRYFHKNGQTVYVILSVTAVRNIEGKLSHFISQIMDITSRIETELKYKETSDRLDVATRVANIGIWDYRIQENTVLCNDNMYSMYGIPKDSSDILNEWMKRIHPEDKERVALELETTIVENKPFSSQFRGVKPNGELVYLIAFGEAQLGDDGSVKNIIGANWDITELRNTELKLERHKESFAETFENAAIGMALIGLDNRWQKVNKSLSKSLGYTEEELVQLTVEDITHPEDIEQSCVIGGDALSHKRDSYQIEKRYIHKNGSTVHVLLTVTVVRNLNGSLSHTIAQILDLTARVHAKKRLTRLVDVTKEQNESLLNFAHIVSHNLRSHSSNLSMLTGFLKKEERPEECENLVRMLGDASESLNETVLHLNEVVQVKVGALDKMKHVNLYKILKNVEKNLSLLLQEKQAICNINVPENLRIRAIPAYLDSIFLNLISNSIKYSDPDRPPVIEITSSEKDEKLVLTVMDNGLGIDLKRHGAKLFGMYKTFHRNKDAKGIGLFITRNQIEAMNGKIEVQSTVNMGTTFTLYFEKN